MTRLLLSSLLVALVCSPIAVAQFGDGNGDFVVRSLTIVVRGDESLVPMSNDALQAAISARTLVDIANVVAESEGVDASLLTPSYAQVMALDSGGSVRLFRISCPFPSPTEVDDEERAKLNKLYFAFGDHIVAHLEETLTNFQMEEIEYRERSRTRMLAELEASRESLQKRWSDATARVLDLESESGESADKLRERLSDMQQEIRAAELNRLRMTARQAAIEKQIVNFKETDESRGVNAEIRQQLEQAIANQEKAGAMRLKEAEARILEAKAQMEAAATELERMKMMAEEGTVSAGELRKAQQSMMSRSAEFDVARVQLEQHRAVIQQELAQARVALLNARRKQGEQSENSPIVALNRQLTQIAIELDESLATRKAFEEAVEGLRNEIRQRADGELQLEMLQQEAQLARNQLQYVEKQRMEVESTRIEPQVPVSVRQWGE